MKFLCEQNTGARDAWNGTGTNAKRNIRKKITDGREYETGKIISTKRCAIWRIKAFT